MRIPVQPAQAVLAQANQVTQGFLQPPGWD